MSTHQPEETPDVDARPAEEMLAHETPTIWVNRFWVSSTEGGIRVALAETGPGGPHYRVAFVVPHAYAAQLQAMIGALIPAEPSVN